MKGAQDEAECGTVSAYRRHLRRGEPTCAPCRAANAAALARHRRGESGPLRELAPCGSQSAYFRHRRHGERPCELCRAAHARATAGYRRDVAS